MIPDIPLKPIKETDVGGLPDSFLRESLSTMLKIRLVEEKIAELVEKKEIICPCHLYIGQEAVAAGVCSSLSTMDYVFSTHRSHGHYIAKGGDLGLLFAEILGRSTGCSGGYGGSMHLVAPEVGFMGSSAIVGGSIPLSVGAALSFSMHGTGRASVAFFGDGAATEGVLFESLNFAALNKLPVLFICENNYYSTHMHITDIQSNINLFEKADSFGVPACRVDGNNVISVHHASRKALARAQAGHGPSFIECMTYRWRGHVGPSWDIEKGLRSAEEVDWWIRNCPIQRMEAFLLSRSTIDSTTVAKAKEEISNEIEGAISYARESPYPSLNDFKDMVFK